MPKTEKYNILHLEDAFTDAELVARELVKNDINFCHMVVDSEADYLAALESFKPDIILCDHSLPAFNSLEALKIIKEKNLKIPFILITATMSEEVAADVVRVGADDYILKDRLKRLPYAVLNAVEKNRHELERTKLIDNVRDSERRYRQIVETAQEGIWLVDKNDQTVFVNKNMCSILGYTEGEMLGKSLYGFIKSVDNADSLPFDMGAYRSVKQYSRKLRTKNKTIITVEISTNPIYDDKGSYDGRLVMVKDITEEEKLKKQLLEEQFSRQKEITLAAINAQEKERTIIGKELHDNVNQILAATRLYLNQSLSRQDYKPFIEKSQVYLLNAIEEIRKLTKALVGLDKDHSRSLLMMIHDMLSDILFAKNIEINFEHYLFDEEQCEESLKIVIYRIIQEQVNNILKHAEATKVDISLTKLEDSIVLIIKDNGKGFDVHRKRTGIGLSNMSNRAHIYNGNVEITSSINNGCCVKAVFKSGFIL